MQGSGHGEGLGGHQIVLPSEPNYYITAPYLWTINFGRREFTSQKSSWELFWGGCNSYRGFAQDFCSIVSGVLGLWEKYFEGVVTEFVHLRNRERMEPY